MHNGQTIISVWNCRAAVSRYEREADSFTLQEASNWQELEDMALDEVYEQGGASNISGHYNCPERLAELATWQ
jgi:hypothetical protein